MSKTIDAQTRNPNNSADMSAILTPCKLEKQGLMTSFGKMVLTKNDTRPQYRFPKEKRLINPYNQKTDYLYSPTSEQNYKYNKNPQWKFGVSPRKSIFQKERFDYYDHPYRYDHDSSYIKKKWEQPVGGDIGCEKRLPGLFKEKVPGPGRYDPDIESMKEKGPSYGIRSRLANNSIMPLTGTNPDISPGSYELAEKSEFHKFSHSPKYKFGNDKRKPLNPKKNTKHETYLGYSSVGAQISSPKATLPSPSFGKAERFQQKINKD